MKRLPLLLLTLALASCSHKAPLVGISCSQYEGQYNLLRNTYTGAITKAGGVPVILPTVKTESEAEALLACLDGIVFSGGEDVNPSWYGEAPLNATVEIDSLRDVSDSLLVRAALRSGKPVLGICRGSQLLNVLLGGSLYQDIPSQLPTAVKHGDATHRIGLEYGGFLARIFGTDSLTVNSFHHQAVKAVAPGVRVTARAADGTVEAYEYGKSVIAFQVHPEGMARTDDAWLAPFSYFVRKVRQ